MLRDEDDDPYRRAVVRLDNASDVVAYRDVRRFGTWLLLEPGELEPYLATRVGVEPLGNALTAGSLADRLARRRAPLKAVVLDQRVFAGVGNIYADEALWWARLHPLRPASGVTSEELKALVRGIKRALRRGIARQGATLRDYRNADGVAGEMQTEFRVYGRAGEPCFRCGHPIEKTRAGGRGTWFCPNCQI
jgi:formamidopyrimidine-DNA glycosylase